MVGFSVCDGRPAVMGALSCLVGYLIRYAPRRSAIPVQPNQISSSTPAAM
jgi:hypothetical protein